MQPRHALGERLGERIEPPRARSGSAAPGATGRRTAAGVANFRPAAQWYFNPCQALDNRLFGTQATSTTLRGFLQLLFLGTPSTNNSSAATVDPWFICVIFQAIIAIPSVTGAAGRRASAPARGSAPDRNREMKRYSRMHARKVVAP